MLYNRIIYIFRGITGFLMVVYNYACKSANNCSSLNLNLSTETTSSAGVRHGTYIRFCSSPSPGGAVTSATDPPTPTPAKRRIYQQNQGGFRRDKRDLPHFRFKCALSSDEAKQLGTRKKVPKSERALASNVCQSYYLWILLGQKSIPAERI